MKVQYNIFEVMKEIRLIRIGHLKRMRSNRIINIILERGAEGRRRKRKHKEQWIDEWTEEKEADLTEEDEKGE